jgi:hypothetical protein
VCSSSRPIAAAFGWWPSPRKGLLWANWSNLASYGPVMVLGLAAMFFYRKAWREHLIFCALFFSLAVVTAVLFAHSSHRSYLDVYWIVFAAGLMAELWRASSPTRVNFTSCRVESLPSDTELIERIFGKSGITSILRTVRRLYRP